MIPLNLPDYSFIQQLEWLEHWACLSPGTLLNSHAALAENWDARDGMTPVILECVENKTWDWPAYNDYAAQYGYEFSKKPVRDMAEHIYSKFRSNRNALYRKHQMNELKEFRPFWQIRGCCADQPHPDATRTYLAADAFWGDGCVPWNCAKLDCRCEVYSLTQIEMVRYIESGVKGDHAAAELLRTWGKE